MNSLNRGKALHTRGGTGDSRLRKLWTVGASALVLIGSFPTDSYADQSATDSNVGPNVLQEVIVTATKRKSTVQNTPISLTAVSGLEMRERGLTDFTSLAQTVPGISMRTSGPGQTEFEMRGMTSGGGNSPTVGFYFDDTPLTAPASANNGKVVIDPNLYDLNRVEVLRGPQGTLYGSGSMGGTIRLVPNAPDLKAMDASANVTASDTEGGGFNHGENGMLNVPLAGGTAALRVVASESRDSGWINRVVIADQSFPVETNSNTVRGNVLAAPVGKVYKDVNSADLVAARAMLLWKPIEQLSISGTFFYQDLHQPGLSSIDSVPGTNAHYQPFDTPESYSDRFELGTLKVVAANLGAAELTSITSYWHRDSPVRQDGDEDFQWAFGLPSFYTSQGGLGQGSSLEDDKSKQLSQEVRLVSTGNSRLKWLVGYFYGDFESDWNLYVIAPGSAALFGTANLYTQFQPTKIIQQSVFGEASYQITPQFTATAGLRRYSYDESVSTAVSGVAGPTGTDQFARAYASERNSGVSPKVNLSYSVSKQLMLYGTVAAGFRPGGANLPMPTSGSTIGDMCEQDLQSNFGTSSFVPSPPTYSPDKVWSYELGEKFQTTDRRVTANASTYFEQWNGVQQAIVLSCGFGYTANAGDAHIYGEELELSARIFDSLTFSGNVDYTHAIIASSRILHAGIYPGIRVQDIPDWTSDVALTYRHALTTGMSLMSRVDTTYTGTRTDQTYYLNLLPSYILTNVRAGLEGNGWSVALFARNVFNKRALLTNTPQVNFYLPTFNRIAISQPLTVGIDANYEF